MKRKLIFIIFIVVAIIGAVVFYFKSQPAVVEGISIINLDGAGKRLLFYGSRHSNDKNNPMFKDIERYFYDTHPQIVLVEGDFNKNKYSDMDSAIARGESAYVTYLAQKEGIPLGSVEPPMPLQFQTLLGEYSKEKILLMYLFRQLYQYQRQNQNVKIDFERETQDYASSLAKQGLPLNEDDLKPGSIIDTLKRYLNQDINNSSWADIDYYSIVYKSGSEINEIYQKVLDMRNQYLLDTIKDNLDKYDRVFIIMGGDHVKSERQYIEEIFSRAVK